MKDYLIDSHCHLHEPWFTDFTDLVERARQNQVNKIINCASDPKNFATVLQTTEFDEISATLGIQPTLTDDYPNADVLREIENLENKVVAIGEIGLDYYWVKDEKKREDQKTLFIDCLNHAAELDLPVVIHTRKAESESLDVLETHAQTPVLLHSFDGNLKEIKRAKDLGYLITVPTIVTRRRNRRKVTSRAGLDNIMIETDAPFCTTRDEIERNEPMYIMEAAEYISSLLEVELDEVIGITTRNAEQFHDI